MLTSVTRFAPTWCAAVALLLLSGMVRAGGDLPSPSMGQVPMMPPNNQGPPDNGTDVFNSCAGKPSGRFETSGSLLFLQPSSDNLVYATVINPYPILSPHWSDQAVRPGFTPAFNVGVRYIWDCAGDIQLSWTHLNTFDNGSTVAPNPLPPVPGIPPLSGSPLAASLGPSFLIGPPPPYASAAAVAHFAYDAINLDAGMFLGVGSHVQLRPFAGLRGARIGQTLSTNFQTSNGAFSFTDVSRSLFAGVGPRLGMDIHYLAGNLDLIGGMAGSILMGTRQSNIGFLTAGPQDAAAGLFPNFQALTSPNTTQVIPGLDARLGASYAIPVGKFGVFKCEAGYQAAVYIHAINQYSLTEVENNLPLQNLEGTGATFLRTAVEMQSNFFVHGPYLRFSVLF